MFLRQLTGIVLALVLLRSLIDFQKENIMKRTLIPLFLVMALLSTFTPLAFAQQSASTSDWTAVQRLNTNARLVVKQKNGKEVKGLMIEATENTLTIDRGGKPLSIARGDVRHIQLIEGKASKAMWALIGAGIGAAGGVLIGQTRRKRVMVYSMD
jgi:hypothetical protein